LGLVLDRKRERIVVVAHPHGGMEIEEIAQREPAAILREEVEPAVGMQGFQARELAFGLGLAGPQVNQAVTAILGAYRAFRELDATMVEINPLVVTQDGRVLALDVKSEERRVGKECRCRGWPCGGKSKDANVVETDAT